MVGWRKRRDNGKAFMVRPKGGKSVSQMLHKQRNEPLSRDELNKVLKDRHIDREEIIPEEEIKQAQKRGENVQGRLISVHPNNSELDNIFVDDESPHIYDELELNQNLSKREEQNRMVAEEKGLEIQEDIDAMRDQENKEKAKE